MDFRYWLTVCSCFGAAAAIASTPVAPARAAERPNILVIVADDLGPTDLGAFGGEIATPNLDQLAEAGLRLTQFHTAATCSPTRAMLMTGTDHHRVGLANMSELTTAQQRGKPGYEGYLNERAVTVAELLRDAGYRTLMSGKWHLGVQPQQDPARRGFERTFSLLQAGHNHFGRLDLPPREMGGVTYTEDGKPVTLPKDFYSSDFFTDKLLEYLAADRDSKRPFFAYLPFSAPHWPLQAPADLIAKYRGRYAAGWDALRRERLQRQIDLGLLPRDVDTSAPTTLLDWNTLNAEERKRQARAMEIYAAMVERMDWNIGRVLQHLRTSGELDRTVVIFFSDNGPEGSNAAPLLRSLIGTQIPPTPLEKMGSIDSLDSYGPHWAQASSAPRRLYKAAATEGGIISPAIIRYPGFARQAELERNFISVMDIAPTLLELAGTQPPGTTYRGRAVEPMQGKSLVNYLQRGASRPHGEEEIFAWELFGQRAVRQGDWKLVYVSPPNGSGRWELYNLLSDPGERRDLSAKHSAVFQRLLKGWDDYAQRMQIVLQEQIIGAYTER